MRRSALDLETIADWRNLVRAFNSASRGKAERREVIVFAANLDRELAVMRSQLLGGDVTPGAMSSFWIRDPKLRLIHAPCFRDRVLHHALMSLAGPELESALIHDTYACRVGKGTLAAVRRCQHHARRFPTFTKIDIRRFFPNIDHGVLNALLERRFKNKRLLRILAGVIEAHSVAPGKGLPIGALTSQHFANFYLASLDRFILEGRRARGYVRYMDDSVWWDETPVEARATLDAARGFARERLLLEFKPPTMIGRSRDGLMFCGLRVLPGALRLSRRRRHRYASRRRFWEAAFCRGDIDAPALQRGYDSALAITAHADAASWRREQLRRRPIAETLEEL
jgi:hypothetical protein